jgi:hypothetical protein
LNESIVANEHTYDLWAGRPRPALLVTSLPVVEDGAVQGLDSRDGIALLRTRTRMFPNHPSSTLRIAVSSSNVRRLNCSHRHHCLRVTGLVGIIGRSPR